MSARKMQGRCIGWEDYEDDRGSDERGCDDACAVHGGDEWDCKTKDDGWEDERDKMSFRAFCGDD